MWYYSMGVKIEMCVSYIWHTGCDRYSLVFFLHYYYYMYIFLLLFLKRRLVI